jgi:hypothetical protein
MFSCKKIEPPPSSLHISSRWDALNSVNHPALLATYQPGQPHTSTFNYSFSASRYRKSITVEHDGEGENQGDPLCSVGQLIPVMIHHAGDKHIRHLLYTQADHGEWIRIQRPDSPGNAGLDAQKVRSFVTVLTGAHGRRESHLLTSG